jgi:hypothetical protein
MQFQADQMWQDAGHEVIENERQPTVPELPMVDVAAVTPDVDSARGKPRWRLATWTFSGGVATLAIVLLLMFQSPQDVTIIGGRATGDIADSPAVPIDRQPAKEDVRQNRASKQPEEAFRPEHPSVEKSAPVQHRKVSTTDPETTRVEPKKVTRKELMLQELPKEMGEAENVLKADDSNLADLTFSSPPAVPEPASVQAGLEPEKSVKKEPEPDLQSSPEVKSPEVVKRGGSKVEGSKRNRTESRRTEGQKKQYSTARKVTTKEPLTETKRSEIAVRKKVSPIEVKVRDEDGKVSFTVDDLQ